MNSNEMSEICSQFIFYKMLEFIISSKTVKNILFILRKNFSISAEIHIKCKVKS